MENQKDSFEMCEWFTGNKLYGKSVLNVCLNDSCCENVIVNFINHEDGKIYIQFFNRSYFGQKNLKQNWRGKHTAVIMYNAHQIQ